VQKIPAVASVTSRPSPIRKEAAFLLTRIPDSIVIHKWIDGTDKRWIEWNNKLKPHPLEENLGFYDFGKYVRAPDDAKHAYEWKKEKMSLKNGGWMMMSPTEKTNLKMMEMTRKNNPQRRSNE
jgi:hypothetical protein